MRLRTSLFLLVLATAIPLAAFSLVVAGLTLYNEYQNFVGVVKDRNRALMSAVDAEVQGTVETVEALASIGSLQTGNLEGFYKDATAALATQRSWHNVILYAPDGRQLVNAYLPWGTALPTGVADPDSFARVVETGRPAVGNVIARGPSIDKAGIPVRVPVMMDRKLAYVLTAILKPESFDALLVAQRMPQGWVTGLVDRRGHFVARIPGRPVGSRASDGYLEAVRREKEGWYRGPTVEGRDTYTAFTVSALTGWSLGFAIPSDLVLGGLQRAAWMAAGVLMLVLAFALTLAGWLGRRIARPMAELAEAAALLGRSDAPIGTRSGIREVGALAGALRSASASILARDRELRRQASELQAADANKSQFLALLSHELRNPLAPLSNGLAILKMRGDPQTVTRTHAMMERQIGQLRRLIDDLLDVSRIDRGKLELRRERVAIDAVVRNAIETAKPNVEAKHHALEVRYSPEPLFVEGDPLRLCQVIANLLNNAAKFTPAGGRIEIATRVEQGQAVVAVADSGIGFAPEDRARIFELFVQLDANRHTGSGLGLGLTLVRSLVEMHGGRIDAYSRGPGQGAVFTVRLPLSEAPAAAAGTATLRVSRVAKGRVLVVDDNVDAADSLADILRMEGFEVRACYAGDAALVLARQFRPDVAFLDLNMPGIAGTELASQLRAERWAEGLRLIALTGMGQKADIERTQAAGFSAHLTKPASAEELVRLAAGEDDGNVLPFDAERCA